MEKSEKDNPILRLLEFFKEAKRICKQPNKPYKFNCPLCGGDAVAVKASLNGHIHAACGKCNFQIMQ